MFQFTKQKFIEWRRRRNLARIRREFAACGHPLDKFDDLKIEAALTRGECRIEQVHLNAKSIVFALRRLTAKRKPSAVGQVNRQN